MNFQRWLELVRKSGVDTSGVDHDWLMQQFRMGSSPTQTAQSILAARSKPAVLIPPVQNSSSPLARAAPIPFIWPIGIASICLVLVLGISCSLNGNRASHDSQVSTKPPKQANASQAKPQPHVVASSPTPTYSQQSSEDDGFSARWNNVRQVFIDQGISVDPWDPSARWTMRAYVPSSIAVSMTTSQARELAGLARTSLGDKAIVYIKSEGGQTLAKASPWGIE